MTMVPVLVGRSRLARRAWLKSVSREQLDARRVIALSAGEVEFQKTRAAQARAEAEQTTAEAVAGVQSNLLDVVRTRLKVDETRQIALTARAAVRERVVHSRIRKIAVVAVVAVLAALWVRAHQQAQEIAAP